MNKAQKRLVSALAAASSVAAVIAPAATVFAATKDEAAKLVAEAKKTLAFVDYNAAYAAVVALPEADQAALLAELSPLWEKVATADIMDVLKQMESMAKTWDLDNYYKVEKIINETVKLERNQQYLMGELTSWGKKAVFTADVVTATDAILKAWTDKTPASLVAAKEAVAKVTNAGSLAWLNTEIASVEQAVPVAVSSVSATSTKTFVVKFNKAVADTTKVTIDVKRSSSTVAVTPSWNADKTEATLTNSVNFSEGAYTVAVKNDGVDLGTSTINVTPQKVAKIEVTSSKMAITNLSDGSQKAYVNYKAYDQYGNDVTATYLANSLNFQTGISTNVTWKNGVITILPATGSTSFMNTGSVVITGYDSSTGVSVSATLASTTQIGTLNNVELKELTGPAGKVLTANDNSTVFYISFNATDMSDNATKNYELVRRGLILGTNDTLTSSSQFVEAKLVQDPTNTDNAAIEVRATANNTLTMDMPIVITAMTYTGKTSSINVTLKKQAQLDTITLMAPSADIAVDESKEIPFIAYDQNGKQITKAVEITPYVQFSGVTPSTNIDGTLKLTYTAGSSKGTVILTATTNTGKMSSITINVQAAVAAETLEVSTTKVNTLTYKATQKYDFGYDAGGLTVKDQYGRTVDMTTFAKQKYRVRAFRSGDAVDVANFAGSGENQVVVTATKAGVSTVTFELYDHSKGSTSAAISTKTVQYTVVNPNDVVGYTIDAVTAPIYAAVPRHVTSTGALSIFSGASTVGAYYSNGTSVYNGLTSSSAITSAMKEYRATPAIYGVTSSGTKVKLGSGVAISATVDNSDDFLVITNNWSYGAPGNFDHVRVLAKDLDQNRTSATTTLTVAIKDLNDGSVKTLSTPISSSTVKPAATELQLKVKTQLAGIKVDGDVVYVDAASAGAVFTDNSFMTDYLGTTAPVRFQAKDQYGKDAAPISYFATSDVVGTNFTVAPNGMITVVGPTSSVGDKITVTAITSNGLAKSVQIKFVSTSDFNAK